MDKSNTQHLLREMGLDRESLRKQSVRFVTRYANNVKAIIDRRPGGAVAAGERLRATYDAAKCERRGEEFIEGLFQALIFNMIEAELAEQKRTSGEKEGEEE